MVAAARSVLAVGEVPDIKYRRAVIQIKSSLATNGPAILFDMDPEYGFQWAGTDELITAAVLDYHSSGERKAPARMEAEEFLKELLQHGPMNANAIEAEAMKRDIAKITLKRARSALGLICKRGKGEDKAWYWQLAHTETHERHEPDEPVTR